MNNSCYVKNVLILYYYCVNLIVSHSASNYTTHEIETTESVFQFLQEWNEKAPIFCNQMTESSWNYTTNVTESNKLKMIEMQSSYLKFEKIQWKKAFELKLDKHERNEEIKRQMKLIRLKRHYALSDAEFAKLRQLVVDMKEVYANSRICQFRNKTSESCEYSLETANRILANSRNYEEQLHIWKSWRDIVGPRIEPRYKAYVDLVNESARRSGFKDAGDEERSLYESEDFESELSNIWDVVSPLYKQLFTYVRSKLIQHYGIQRIKQNGPLPAHIFGNMWAQNWKNIIDIVLPFEGKRRADVTKEIIRQKYTPFRMFQVAEEFFTSLGLKAMPVEFWRYSIFEKPTDGRIICKSSAWDFCNAFDYRIKQCTENTMEDLFSAHHEMAHLQYYLQYSSKPFVFRDGANPAFHEAISDMILLSVMTPKHLQRIGLLNNVSDDYETTIDFLLELALDKIPYLPFAYLVDIWRWSVFREGTDSMNSKWWDLRLRYQGLIPPVEREYHHFDPASKYHIISDIPYIKYFISVIIQFQLHEAMCITAGYTGPLHTCDIYRSREAGLLLSEVMSMGSTRHWKDVILIGTRGRSNHLDARPLIEYFKPLYTWLQLQNRNNHKIGWSFSRSHLSSVYEPWGSNTSMSIRTISNIFSVKCLLFINSYYATTLLF